MISNFKIQRRARDIFETTDRASKGKYSANLVSMLIPVGGGQYSPIETYKRVEQFSGPMFDPCGPRPFPWFAR